VWYGGASPLVRKFQIKNVLCKIITFRYILFNSNTIVIPNANFWLLACLLLHFKALNQPKAIGSFSIVISIIPIPYYKLGLQRQKMSHLIIFTNTSPQVLAASYFMKYKVKFILTQ